MRNFPSHKGGKILPSGWEAESLLTRGQKTSTQSWLSNLLQILLTFHFLVKPNKTPSFPVSFATERGCNLNSAKQAYQSDSKVSYLRKLSGPRTSILAGTSWEVKAALFWDRGKHGSFLISTVAEAPYQALCGCGYFPEISVHSLVFNNPSDSVSYLVCLTKSPPA